MKSTVDLMRIIGYCGHLGRQHLDLQLRQRGYDITPVQSHTLHFLACRGANGPVTQRDLEKELGLKASTVNGIVSRLEEKGHISRRQSDTDGRCRLVELTDSGRALVQTFRDVAEATQSAAFQGLSDQEQAQLRSLLQRIIANLENEVKGI